MAVLNIFTFRFIAILYVLWRLHLCLCILSIEKLLFIHVLFYISLLILYEKNYPIIPFDLLVIDDFTRSNY